jgi:hypothetical protein
VTAVKRAALPHEGMTSMSTVQVHAARLPKPVWPHAVFGRVTAFLKAAYEIFTEAQIQAHEARRRYPYLNSRDN